MHTEYKAGGNWERELFVESSSFAASAATGMLVVNAGLTLMMAATPVGWVGLIVASAAIAGTAAATSMGVNYAFKENSGSWYDGIMNWINSK